MSIILSYDTLQPNSRRPTVPLVDTVINEPLRLSAPLQQSSIRLLQLFHVIGFSVFWHPPTNNIKLSCFATCTSKLLLHSAKSSNYVKKLQAKTPVGTTLIGPPCRPAECRHADHNIPHPYRGGGEIKIFNSLVLFSNVKKRCSTFYS